jgi:hypothetical protein
MRPLLTINKTAVGRSCQALIQVLIVFSIVAFTVETLLDLAFLQYPRA